MLSREELKKKYFKSSEHPYRKYESKIELILNESDTLLDAGCGRTAPILSKFANKARTLIGVDLEEPKGAIPEITYIKGNISSIDVMGNSVDVVISRAVLEHVPDPGAVFKEISRVLKPGGSFILLVPNLTDYVSLISMIIPNRFHKQIVSKTEGRNMDDVFPAYYKANTYSSIKALSESNGFGIAEFQYLGQEPTIFKFNSFLYMLATGYEKIISRFEFLGFLRGWILVQLNKK